jgi:glycosyltransferase involved in cell wall biosynthesis
MMSQDPAGEHVILSVVVIAKNERDRIPRLLSSVAGIADEIIVVDSGSTDGTIELCHSRGARVVHRDWTGYVAQKQYAMELARGEWALNLDADEALAPEACEEIRHAISVASSDIDGFSQPRLSRYLNRWIRHGGWYPDRKVRLVRKGRAKWVGDGLHERVEVTGRVDKLRHPILHYVYRNISDQVKTIDSFSTVVADQRTGAAPAWYVLWGVIHAVGKFLECAVWKLGVLDGIPGVIIAMNSAFYVFLKHAKAWEKRLRPSASPEGDVSS